MPPGTRREFGFVQMRPLALMRETEALELGEIDPAAVLCRSQRVLGNGRIEGIRDLVVVDFQRFERSRSRDAAAEVVRLNGLLLAARTPYALVGVGRWGSRDPWLGIPVTWDQASGAQVIVEAGLRDLKVTPSQGTHFFQNLTSFNVGYFTVNPDLGDGFVDWAWFSAQDACREAGVSRMENEAQLATLLAHEMSHCTHRHSVEQFRDLQNKTAFLATLQVTTAPLGGIGDVATLLGALGTMAAVTGYSREHESEADEQGFRRVVEAGYDPQETPKLFQHLKRDIEEEKIKEPFFFGTHPRVKERIENYERLLAREQLEPVAKTRNAEQFTQQVHHGLLDNASLDLKRGRFNQAQTGIERYLTAGGEEARPYFLLGELCRQRGVQGDTEKAIAYYRKSIEFDPSYPEACRGLGFLYLKEKEKGLAKAHFEHYLALAPQAADRLYIEQYMKQLQ